MRKFVHVSLYSIANRKRDAPMPDARWPDVGLAKLMAKLGIYLKLRIPTAFERYHNSFSYIYGITEYAASCYSADLSPESRARPQRSIYINITVV